MKAMSNNERNDGGKKVAKNEEQLPGLEELLRRQEETRQRYEEHFGPPVELPDLDEATRQKIMDLFGPLNPEGPTPQEVMDEYFNKPIQEEPLTDDELDRDLAGGRYKIPITLREYPALRSLMGRRRP